jgi:alkaline phosphatase D
VKQDVKNLAVLSGDLHTFVAGNLYTNGETSGTAIGTELVGGSATSLGLPQETGISSATLEAIRPSADPHIVFAEFDHRGYCVIQVGKTELAGEFKAVSDATNPHGTVSSLAKFKVEAGSPTLHQV